MANNLKDHLKEVADAIRAKKGTSDLINPQDFATEIEGITSGSGGESGSSSWRYFDLKALGANAKYVLDPFFLIKGKVGGGSATIISPTQLFIIESNAEIYAAATDESAEIVVDSGETMSISALLAQLLPQLESMGLVEITQEQFYDLNA